MIASAAFSLMALQFGFDLVPPQQTIGWVYLAAITFFSTIAFVLTLQAINRVGGAIFALFLNFEPVVILILAWAVIGEELSIQRITGIALIVIALFLSHYPSRPTKESITGVP